MSFYQWILLFKNVDRPIGDLANDILKAKDFPRTGEREEIRAWILKNSVHRGMLPAFENAWDYYKVDSF